MALYQLDILAALTQTGIQQTAAGGKARAFCDIVGDQLGTGEPLLYSANGFLGAARQAYQARRDLGTNRGGAGL